MGDEAAELSLLEADDLVPSGVLVTPHDPCHAREVRETDHRVAATSGITVLPTCHTRALIGSR
jgi:hypothetical protein